MYDYIWVTTDFCIWGRLHTLTYWNDTSGTFLGQGRSLQDTIAAAKILSGRTPLPYGIKFAEGIDVPVEFEYV